MIGKRWIAAIVLIIVVLSAGAVFAAVDMGGTLALDVYYYRQDKAGFGRGRMPNMGTPGTGGYAGINDANPTLEDDRSLLFVDFNKSSVFWMRWASENGIGLYVSPYLKGDETQSHGTGALNVGIAVAYGWWDITRDLKLTAGKGAQDVFSPYEPTTSMGYDGVSKCIGVGYGNVSSRYQNGLALAYKLSDTLKINLALLESRLTDPNNTSYTSMNPGLKPNAPGAYVDNTTLLPKIEASGELTFGKMTLIPNAMWLRQTFDNIAEGADDTIVAWGLGLSARVIFGKLTIKGELQKGQNWYNASKTAVATPYPFKSEYIGPLAFAMSAKADARGKLYDSDNLSFWGQATYRIGRFLPTVIYGQMLIKRDIPGQEADIRTQMYGVNCPIILNRHFYLIPEVMIYDSGGSNRFVSAYAPASSQYYDCGRELLAGMQFRFVF